MKKLITLLLALLFILTSCAPAVVEEAPAPESTPEPAVEVTPIPIPVTEKMVLYIPYQYIEDPCSHVQGVITSLKESGVEYEVFPMLDEVNEQADIDAKLQSFLEKEAKCKAIILEDYASLFVIRNKTSIYTKQLLEDEIPTIHLDIALDVGITASEILEYKNHYIITDNVESAGTVLAEYTAEKLSGKSGELLYAPAFIASGSIPTEQLAFSERWEELKTENQLDKVNINYGASGYSVEEAVQLLNTWEVQEPLGVITYNCKYLGEAFNETVDSFEDAEDLLIIDAYSSEEDLALLSEGVIDAIIEPPYYEMGYQAGLAAVRALKGEEVEKYTEVPYTIITEETL